MPRKTAKEEATRFLQQFLSEAKDSMTAEVLKTRQPKRRTALLKEIDALDRVESRFYNWINGIDTDAA